jgi:hypothetical protein
LLFRDIHQIELLPFGANVVVYLIHH